MLCGIGETFRRLKDSGRKIILFELVYKLGATAIVYPLLILMLEGLLAASGVNYLTNEYIVKILANPFTWCVAFVALIVFVAYCVYEMSYLLVCFESQRQACSVSMMDIAWTALKNMRGIVDVHRLPLVLYYFISLVAVNIVVICNLVLSETTRNVLRMYIFNGISVLRWIIVALLAAMFIYVIPRIFVFCISLLTGVNVKQACNRSRSLVRKNLFKVLGSLLVYNLSVLIVIFVFYLFISIILVAGVKLLDMAYMGSAIYLSVLKYVRVGTKLVLVYTAVPMSFTLIYNLFIRLYHEDDIELVIFHTGLSTRIHGSKIYAGVLALSIVLNCVYMMLSFNKNPFEKIAIFHETKITAHRGSSITAPENTLAAFQEAINNMADFIEIDVTLTKDGIPVVIHDSNALRTTGVNREISDMTFYEVKQLDAGIYHSAEYAGERIPTLYEVLELAKGKIEVNIEIKPGNNSMEVAEKVVEAVRAKSMVSECVVTSFEIEPLRRVKQLEPQIQVGYILVVAYGDFYNMEDVDFFSVNAAFLTKRLVDAIHNSGKQIHAWTVNNQSSIKNLSNKGVDNIITDDPVLARETVYSRNTSETIVNMAKYVFNR